ncbi:MAG: oligosaccharide flippase family protein, partial [Methanomicrobium sp.]|nr:oligosaccharide flippase family protein [Methanomicrobium sp.]
ALGAGLLGEYWIFLAYFGVFSIISDGGSSGAAVKKISEGHDSEEYFTASLVIRFILIAATVFIVILSASLFVDFGETGLLPFLLAAIIISGISSVISSGVYARGNVGINQISGLVDFLVRIAVQVICVYAGFLTGGLAAGFIAGLTAGIFVNLGHLKIHIKKFSRHHIKSLAAFSGWTFLSSAFMCITAYAGTILVGYFLKSSDAGIYTTALALTSVVTFSASALQTALYPKFSRWHAERNFEYIENALSRIFTYSLALALPAVSGGIILGKEILYYLYGADFAEGYSALIFLFIAQLAQIFVISSLMTINAAGHPDCAFKAVAIQSMAVLALNIIFIPFIGIAGAGLSLMAANIAGAIITLWYAGQFTKIKFQKTQIRNILFSVILMTAFLLFSKTILPPQSWYHALILVICGALVYCIILLKTDSEITNNLKVLLFDIGIKL